RYLTAPAEESFKRRFTCLVSHPDRVVEIIDDFLAEHFRQEPFNNGWSQGRAFTVDEDAIVCRGRRQQTDPFEVSSEDHVNPGERVSRLVEQPPSLGREKGGKPNGVALIAQQVEVLFKPKPLGWGLAGGIWNKEEYFHGSGSRPLLPEFV